LSWARQHACLSNPPPARSQPALCGLLNQPPADAGGRAGQFGVLEPATRAGVFGFLALLPPAALRPEFASNLPLAKNLSPIDATPGDGLRSWLALTGMAAGGRELATRRRAPHSAARAKASC
jgi:hypothetical protein